MTYKEFIRKSDNVRRKRDIILLIMDMDRIYYLLIMEPFMQ